VHVCARGLSVTKECKDVSNGVLFSELNVLNLGTSCVIYNHNHTLGRMWTSDFAGKSEFRLLLQNAKDWYPPVSYTRL
jgi:hypothetical protein